MNDENFDDSDELEKGIFAGYTKDQLDRVSRFNQSVIDYANELQKAVEGTRKNNDKVRGETGGKQWI